VRSRIKAGQYTAYAHFENSHGSVGTRRIHETVVLTEVKKEPNKNKKIDKEGLISPRFPHFHKQYQGSVVLRADMILADLDSEGMLIGIELIGSPNIITLPAPVNETKHRTFDIYPVPSKKKGKTKNDQTNKKVA
jgi:hypothetical protein